jgi:hypothetical protein
MGRIGVEDIEEFSAVELAKKYRSTAGSQAKATVEEEHSRNTGPLGAAPHAI